MKYSKKIKIVNWVYKALRINAQIDIRTINDGIRIIKVSKRIPVSYLSGERSIYRVKEELANDVAKEIIAGGLAETVVVSGMGGAYKGYETEGMAELHMKCYVLNPKKI